MVASHRARRCWLVPAGAAQWLQCSGRDRAEAVHRHLAGAQHLGGGGDYVQGDVLGTHAQLARDGVGARDAASRASGHCLAGEPAWQVSSMWRASSMRLWQWRQTRCSRGRRVQRPVSSAPQCDTVRSCVRASWSCRRCTASR